MNKSCTKCGVSYPIEHFSKKGSGRSSRCAKCVAEYFQNYYHNNEKRRADHVARVRKNSEVQRKLNQSILIDAFRSGCTDCGVMDIRVLEFDHLSDKVANVSSMMNWSSKKLKEEISKCEVVCSNCHAIRTSDRQNSWRTQWVRSSAVRALS